MQTTAPEDTRRAEHHRKMTRTPVSRLVSRLAVPTIISMLVSSIYSAADTFFVSRIGTSAAAAVGVVFPVMAIIQAVGFTIGMGGGVRMSRQLGAREDAEATITASSAFFLSLALGLVLTILGIAFSSPLMRLLGASETVLPHAGAYANWIFLACPFMCSSYVMNNLLRSEGKAAFAMIGITTGGILNIILDPVFIFAFGLGVGGAAIATALSQVVSFLILLSCFLLGKSNVRLSARKVSAKGALYRDILKMGLPSLARQGFASIASVALNISAAAFGDAALAAMTIANRVTFLLFSALLGFGQGYQPVASYNYGAGLRDRVLAATKFTAVTGTCLITALAAICFAVAEPLMGAFSSDPEVVSMGVSALRAQCLALPLTAIVVTTNMGLQATGRYRQATFMSLCRQGIFFIPLVIILPKVFGLMGLLCSQAAADALTFVAGVMLFTSFIRSLKETEAPR